MAARARRPSSAAQRTCRPGTPTRTFAVAVLTALGDRNRESETLSGALGRRCE